MKKNTLILPLALVLGLTASARSLSPSEALSRIKNHPVSRSVSAPVMTVGTDDTPAIYVFSKGENGYMIVSADDVAAPLLGYSDNGVFDPQNMPDNMRWWLEQCAAEINAASAAGVEAYTESRSTEREPIEPLMTTRWNQNAPYYNDCPKIGDQPTMSGCVATAMAMVMKYHNWPKQAGENAYLSYKWYNGEIVDLTADFRNYEFDWANMIDDYSSDYDDVQASAVSKLMQACGYSVNMSYGISASGAFAATVGGALATYFKYDAGLHNEPRELYSAKKWEEIIYEDLKNCGPIVYWGSGSGSHCFVCDGYNRNGYFHFNWGWGGMSDGYFLLNALTPGATGIGGSNGGFNNYQGVLLGVKPAGSTASQRRYTFYMPQGINYVEASPDLTIYGNFYNFSPYNVKGKYVFRIYSEDGSQLVTTAPVSLPTTNDLYSNSYETVLSGTVPSTLPEGTYRIYPAVEIDGEVHLFRVPAGYTDHVLYTRSASGNSVVIPAPEGALSVDDLSTNGDLYIGKRFKVSGIAKFSVDGGDVDRYITASLLRQDGSVAGSGSQLNIKFSYDGTPFEFISNWFTKSGLQANIPAGDYTFALISNGMTIASCPVTVKAEAPESSYKILDCGVDATDKDHIYAVLKIEGLSGLTDETIEYEVGQGLNRAFKSTVDIFVTEGSVATIKFTFAHKYALDNSVHYLIFNRYTSKEYKTYFTIGKSTIVQSGIEDIEADENAAVEYFNLQGISVDADNLTPGIYIRRQGSKAEKILVK